MTNRTLIRMLTVLALVAVALPAEAQRKKRRAKEPEPAAAAPVQAQEPAAPPAPIAPEPEPAPAPAEPAPEPMALSLSTSNVDTETGSGDGLLFERGGLANLNLVIGAKVGGGFSQPFGDLGSSFLTELEIGYTLPVLHRAVEIFLSGAYTQPKAEGKNIEDERLPAPASYTLTQQQAIITLGGLYRLKLPIEALRPYVAVGPRLYMMRTKISGEAGGESFGDNEEVDSKVGLFGALGAEYHFGPGAAFFEASMAWAKIDGYVMRDTSAGALNLALGYRLFI